MTRGARAWTAVGILLALGALLATRVDAHVLDWQSGLAAREPWRAWSGAWVHYSRLHLGVNLAGTVAVVAFGLAARVPPRSAVAWFIAWPLTQAALLVRPELAHYGGLSGVLHAGVAAAATYLALAARAGRRWIGLAVLAGETIKVGNESPWGDVLRHPPGWDIAVAPLAHATGLIMGLVLAAVAEAVVARIERRT